MNHTVQMAQHELLDREWVFLMVTARDMGIKLEDVRSFFQVAQGQFTTANILDCTNKKSEA